jgi:hypothetical protein
MRTPLLRIKSVLAAYPFVTVLCTWVLIMGVAYLFMSLHHVYQVESARKAGLETVQETARKVGLPLLERNLDALQATLADIGLRPGVLLAWIADHQNRVVALAGSDQLLPSSADAARPEVEVRQSDLPLPAIHFNLVSPVSYSGTRIGRIGLSIAPDVRSDPKDHFVRVVVLSGFFVLALIGALYHRHLARMFRRWSGSAWEDAGPALDLSRSDVTCPLCGRNQPYTGDLFDAADGGELTLVTIPAQPGQLRPTRIRLNEAPERRDLAAIRQRIVGRCAEVIKLLSG